jgi:hypothetical protein
VIRIDGLLKLTQVMPKVSAHIFQAKPSRLYLGMILKALAVTDYGIDLFHHAAARGCVGFGLGKGGGVINLHFASSGCLGAGLKAPRRNTDEPEIPLLCCACFAATPVGAGGVRRSDGEAM